MKQKKKQSSPLPQLPRNWMAVAAHFKKAGSHKDSSKYSRKVKYKEESRH